MAKGVSATAAAAAGGVVDAHMASKAAVADEALRLSVAGGEYEALARSLEEHGQHASEAVLAEARAAKNRLKERRKKESIRLRKQHAGAMGALQQLHGLSTMAAVDELRERLQSAEHHAGTLTALDEELEVVRARLQGLTPVESVASGPVELTLDQLLAGTDGFASSKLVGSGGFGKVFEGTLLLPSLPAGAVPLELHHLPVAVKKARSRPGLATRRASCRGCTARWPSCVSATTPICCLCSGAAAATQTPASLSLHSCLHTHLSGHAAATRGPRLAVLLTWPLRCQVLLGPSGAMSRLPADAWWQLRRPTQARRRETRAPAAAGAALTPQASQLAAEAPHHDPGDTAL